MSDEALMTQATDEWSDELSDAQIDAARRSIAPKVRIVGTMFQAKFRNERVLSMPLDFRMSMAQEIAHVGEGENMGEFDVARAVIEKMTGEDQSTLFAEASLVEIMSAFSAYQRAMERMNGASLGE